MVSGNGKTDRNCENDGGLGDPVVVEAWARLKNADGTGHWRRLKEDLCHAKRQTSLMRGTEKRAWMGGVLGPSSCKGSSVNSFFLLLGTDLNLKLGYDRMRSTTPSSTFWTPMTLTMHTTATRSASSKRGRHRSPQLPSPRSCSSSSKPLSNSFPRRLEPVPSLPSFPRAERKARIGRGEDNELCYPNHTTTQGEDVRF